MRYILIIILSLLVLSACRDDRQEDFFLSEGRLKIHRYDRLQFEASALNSFTSLQKMNMNFPHATKLLIEDVLALGSVNDEKINDRLCAYYSDTSLVNLMLDVEDKYKDLGSFEKDLTKGFLYLKKRMSSFPIPVVYSQISALNQSVVVSDSLIGISLDKYMGEDYPMYKRYYYNYQRVSMNPDRIVPDCLSFYLLSLYPFPWDRNHRTLFDLMMYRGKIAWITEKALGSEELGTKVLGYNDMQLEWCRKNKKQFIEWVNKANHLESTDPMIIRSYLQPMPNRILNEDVPPMIGIWLGMQYIDEYMKKNPGVTFEELLNNTDYEGMLLDIDI
ncbi:gliding motility lipoprotein GldB [uncultured Bacteroides sp.]|uniref:gliding motility protein GldB-related protein n=1 Tax=uncultured Bacteroides sp. TaxID=162156 RepID=UPI00262FCA48|nr:gliding motility lipoprotein GldB [uncultured Bacteroides sp.]